MTKYLEFAKIAVTRVSSFYNTAVFWTFLVTVLRAAGFFLVLPVTLRTIPTDELGLWYVFLSIAQFASILEMGFSPTIGRFASYYLGGAKQVQGLGLSPQSSATDGPNYSGLLGLIRIARSLYLKISLSLGFVMLIGGGAWLFTFYPKYISDPKNLIAFLFFVFGTTVNMFGYFWPGLLFGLNKVRTYQQSFVIGLICSYIFCVVGLFLGWGLFALAGSQFLLGIITRIQSYMLVRREIPRDLVPSNDVRLNHLWPMTWRTGLGSLAGYFSLPITTLICAQVTDLGTTSSYGLSLQLAFMLHGLSGAWLAVKYPLISSMRSKGQIAEIRTLVWRRMTLSMATYFGGGIVAALVCPAILSLLDTKTQFLPTPMLCALLFTVGIDFFLGMHIAILQTGNHTPYLNSLVLSGILTVAFGYLLGHSMGIYGIILSPVLAHACYNLWYTPMRCWKDLQTC